ncbi:coiled-coil domain-containing protein 106-like [Pseudorasbora parva]|uniref:coiled-coil domain-containing protein 106-like n=1 Tax=Pseudorasbora parva TaxID=51549 RepID=UPI00351ECDD9
MENSDKSRKGVRARGKKNASVEKDAMNEMSVSETSGVSMAPTAHLADRRKSHELEMLKLKVEWQKDKIDELTKERDYLKEQLASALKRAGTGSRQASPVSTNSPSDSDESSSDTISDSSSASSSEGGRKKKKKRMKGKEKKYGKKKMETKTCQRAQTPQQVVARYKRVLRHFSRGGTMSAAFKHVGVDRNTVVVNAPIAELYITAPVKYKELLNHSSQVKLSAFATQCAAAIQEDPAIEDTIKAFKASGKLLPLKRK